MLPTEKSWYRNLLMLALLLGAAGGIGALIFMGVINGAGDFFYGNTGIDWWAGHWWWIPLTALGGLIVALLRRVWQVPAKVPGGIALVQQGWVNPETAPYWITISAISLITGASLGPSFGLIVMGGALGAWIIARFKIDDEDVKQDYSLTGMAGGMGGAFSAPLFATIMTSEMSPTPKQNYVTAFIPQLLAATIGFAIFFGVTGSSILGQYLLPAYDYDVNYLLTGALLGVLSTFVLISFALINKMVAAAFQRISNPLISAPLGGALVGLIAFSLPLTAASGSSQLATQLEISATLGTGFIVAVLIAKMVAVALSQASGFLGGMVFPMIFLGGTAGILVNNIFPSIPLSLAVAAMLAAVPGAFLRAPVTLTLIAVGTVGIGPTAMIPVAVAVVVAHITLSFIRSFVIKQRDLPLRGN